jgi:hypothetical protein
MEHLLLLKCFMNVVPIRGPVSQGPLGVNVALTAFSKNVEGFSSFRFGEVGERRDCGLSDKVR